MYISQRRRKKESGKVLMLTIIFGLFILTAGYFTYRIISRELGANKNAPVGRVASSTTNTQVFSTTTTVLTADSNDWRRFVADKGDYEVRFPRSLFTWSETEVALPPNYNEKSKAVKLSYSIPVKYCGESGLPEHCTPTTENMSISFVVVGHLFNEVFTSLQKAFGPNLPIVSVDGHQGVKIQMGAEGEGAVYYVVPDGPSTLFIVWTYKDESVLGSYQNEPSFIKYEDQVKIFDKILGTFKFNG